MDYTITFAFRYRGKTPRIIALKQKPRPTSYSSTLMSKLHLAAICLRATQNISKWVLLVTPLSRLGISFCVNLASA